MTTIKDGEPFRDELLTQLGYEDLMCAYLTAKVTPEQEHRIMARLREIAPKR